MSLKMKSRTTVSILFLFSVSLIAFSGCKIRSPQERLDILSQRVSKHLDLDQDQVKKLEALKQEVLAVREETKKRRVSAIKILISEVRSDQLSSRTIETLIHERQAVVNEVAPRVLRPLVEFQASLRPAQKEKITEKLERLQAWMSR